MRDSKLFVACGQGALELVEVQPEGGKRMSAHGFALGHEVDCLGL